MLIVSLLQWWYGDGWARQLIYARDRVIGINDYFSVDLLAKSWFEPFRQISAGRVQGSLSAHWQAFVDKTISRFIGSFMRTLLIIIGCVAILIYGIASVLAVVIWALVPVLPIVGLVFTLIGWLPWLT